MERKLRLGTLFYDMLDMHKPTSFSAVNSDNYFVMVNECLKLVKVDDALALQP